jgi:hypothetical protein
MNIRLTKNLPVKENIGALKGMEFEAVNSEINDKVQSIEFVGNTGEIIIAFEDEYEIIK